MTLSERRRRTFEDCLGDSIIDDRVRSRLLGKHKFDAKELVPDLKITSTAPFGKKLMASH